MRPTIVYPTRFCVRHKAVQILIVVNAIIFGRKPTRFFNVVIGEEIAPLELNFTVPGEGSTELMINLGKITPNPENPDDTTPENFTVTIDKIEVYEITGEETQTPVYTNDFAAADDDVGFGRKEEAEQMNRNLLIVIFLLGLLLVGLCIMGKN